MAISFCLYSDLEKSRPEAENGLLTAFACQWIKAYGYVLASLFISNGRFDQLIGTFLTNPGTF